jgi:hypothetical protein
MIDVPAALAWAGVIALGLAPFAAVVLTRRAAGARTMRVNALQAAAGSEVKDDGPKPEDERLTPEEVAQKYAQHRAAAQRAARRLAVDMVRAGLVNESTRHRYAGLDQDPDAPFAAFHVRGGRLGALREHADPEYNPDITRAADQVHYATEHLDPRTYAATVAGLWRAGGGTCFPGKATAHEAVDALLQGAGRMTDTGESLTDAEAARRLAVGCGALYPEPARELPASVEELQKGEWSWTLPAEHNLGERVVGDRGRPLLPFGSKSDLRYAKLGDADLRNQHLAGADLTKAHLRNARLDGADLSGANLDEADAERTSFQHAILRNANLHDLYANGADFRGAELRGANMRLAKMSGADVDGARFEGADLTAAYTGGMRNAHAADLEGAVAVKTLSAGGVAGLPDVSGWKWHPSDPAADEYAVLHKLGWRPPKPPKPPKLTGATRPKTTTGATRPKKSVTGGTRGTR